MKTQSNIGFTLIELLIVIAIVAILAVLAVPSFNKTLDKKRITSAAEAVLADLRWARAESIKRNKKIRVTFVTGSNWSYTINADPTGANTLLKTVNGSNFFSTAISSASFAGGVTYTTFDPVRGTNPNNGTTTITSSYFSAGVSVSTLGRARICGDMGGYEAC
ncbi:GspH/FimT family pseudopilin [Methylomicrobium sp. Wu6]|uniref:GspH/FimT family pseudopilin n=1 Tax=Methylomicrobium sp. Wu6 TaxID=3107928 RepID=UPI002DD659C6|nr:GspH/FimT family pseudopilin [Methylomicrobium sp. Wu6]MEC4747468.1 GspH/FimT family pseudopilin [Methylomicrobium sp. Wu6]